MIKRQCSVIATSAQRLIPTGSYPKQLLPTVIAGTGSIDMNAKKVFAIADMAGTVLKSDPWDLIRQHPVFLAQKPQMHIARFLPYYGAAKIGIVSDERLRDQWLVRMAAVYTGLHHDTIMAMYEDVIDDVLETLLNAKVVQRLEDHQRDGASVILASGMFSDFLSLLARRLGFDGVVGTDLLYENDVCTGRIAGETCVGQRKIAQVLHYIRQKDVAITPEDCFAYADSASDLPLLRTFGHAVAVSPDDELRQVATDNNWDIVE